MEVNVSCFVAYPSEPPSLAEIIEKAIEELNKGQIVTINGWKSSSVTGKFIINTICQDIKKRDLFICDLTNLNHNVLFELGYAIAKKRRTWILLDPSIEKSRTDYDKFKLLTTVGYSPYRNHREIVEAFYKDEPYSDLESTIYKDAIESVIKYREEPTLFYLQSGIETEASIKLSRRVYETSLPIIIDDPNEVRIQTLSWYAQEVYNAFAVIVHFLSQDRSGWHLHNAKNSFVSGLAHGFGKNLLMLAHEPYKSPIDYRELLQTHRTAEECNMIASSWLDEIEQKFNKRTADVGEYVEIVRAHSELQSISIGDYIAENESDSLLDYFIPVAPYEEALVSKRSICVGRKGSGKTAFLYKLADDIQSDIRNHICLIKPVAYELEGILRMLRQALPQSEKGYLIESFWKFLIYTEIAKSIYDEVESQPLYQLDEAEKEMLDYVRNHSSLITPGFSIRLESIVSKLQHLSDFKSGEDQRARMSELLHIEVIGKLRSILGKVLQKKNKVAILVDNLDKAWKPREDLVQLCDLLFGMLSVSQSIVLDFEKSDNKRQSVNLSIIIFLRSDIFSQVIKYARERDKISYSMITWDDPETLIRVLEERFIASPYPRISSPKEVWSKYFCASVRGIPTRSYLTKYILPRPRDLIYLSKTAIAQAVNRRHAKVEEEDILEAQNKYSQYALDTIIVENSIQIEALESLLYEFVGSEEVINSNDILEAMKICKIPEDKLDEVIELLCDLTFIGMEVANGRFEFLYNEENKAKFQVMSRKITQGHLDKLKRFRINDAFHAYLEIIPVSSS